MMVRAKVKPIHYQLSHLQHLESEAIHILREVAAEFRNPVLLYSVGKDSGVLVRLAQKAFHPGPIPFPLLHVDTGYKFPEMYEFRDTFCRDAGARLIVERNEEWIAKGSHPLRIGADACCGHLKTQALLDALRKHAFDAAIGGARREEEKSRAKERVFSIRDAHGQWDPKNQRPELWDLYNCRVASDETIRAFPLSNWTELDVWRYIEAERMPVVPLYFARERLVVRRNGILIPHAPGADGPGASPTSVTCRFRSLGCMPCTGAVASSATTVEAIIAELAAARTSERENRVIDLTGDASMEQKKRDGYF
jgi:sulfate adenylyltransferase subunit 2